MNERTLDLRKVFGMIVTYDKNQHLVAPEMSFDVVTELYPGGESAIHIHPQQEEVYEVKEGEIQVYLEKTWRTLKAGDRVTISKGTIHAFRNMGNQKAIAFNSHHPGLRFGEMIETMQEYINEGKITSTKGFRNSAYMSSIIVKYKDVMTTIKPPPPVVKLMAALGKSFGYK